MHLKPIVTTPPSAEDLDNATWQLCSALDGLLACLATLQPAVNRWDPPSGALGSAMRGDAACSRLQTRVKDALRNLRAVLSEDDEVLMHDVDDEVQALASAAAATGFALGVSCARSAASGRAVA